MTVNNMSSIDRNSIRVSASLVSEPNFLLGGNPVQCNCHMLWFRYNSKVQLIHAVVKLSLA